MVIENTIPNNEKNVPDGMGFLSYGLERIAGHILNPHHFLDGFHRLRVKKNALLAMMALSVAMTACNFDLRDSRWHPVGYVSLEPGLVLCEGEYIVNSLGHDGIHLKVKSEAEGEDEKIWDPEVSGLYCSDNETMYSIIRTRGSDRSYYPEAPHQRLDIFKRSYKPKR